MDIRKKLVSPDDETARMNLLRTILMVAVYFSKHLCYTPDSFTFSQVFVMQRNFRTRPTTTNIEVDVHNHYIIQLRGSGARSELRVILDRMGLKLGPYSSRASGYLVVATPSQAGHLKRHSLVQSVGIRSIEGKIAPELLGEDNCSCSSRYGEATLYAMLASGHHAQTGEAEALAEILRAEADSFVTSVECHDGPDSADRPVIILVASKSKLSIRVPKCQRRAIAAWLAGRPDIVLVESRPAYAARNNAEGRIVLGGASEQVLLAADDELPWRKLGLNGSGQVCSEPPSA